VISLSFFESVQRGDLKKYFQASRQHRLHATIIEELSLEVRNGVLQ
jgi:predicted transcriptional regulator